MTEKLCPNCLQRRPFTEMFCEGLTDGMPCQWDLTSVPIVAAEPWGGGQPPAPVLACPDGHPVSSGDLICPVCGLGVDLPPPTEGLDEPSQAPFEAPPEPTFIDGWEVVSRRDMPGSSLERFTVHRSSDGLQGILSVYPPPLRPTPGLYEAIRALGPRPCATILASGEHGGRHFEIAEAPACGTLAELTLDPQDTDRVRELARVLGDAIGALARAGIRHCDLRPEAILIHRLEPLELSIICFGAARLSLHDLDLAALPELSRYMAPETLAGAVAAASDWWSLGIVLLEKLTQGACFDGINDQAFLMHVMASGAEIPADLDGHLRHALRGLLSHDRGQRWQWPELDAWLKGEPVPAPPERGHEPDQEAAIQLGGRVYRRPSTYALAAGLADHWDEAREQLANGAVATWLEGIASANRMLSALRNLLRRDGIDNDLRLSLALKILNPDMPLTRNGTIITPGWLLRNLNEGYRLISGPASEILSELSAESWLTELHQREINVRRRAKQHDIELNEETLRVNLLATSRSQLGALWEEQRRLAPDSNHKGIAAIMERRGPGVEDLILLLSAGKGQFQPLSEIVAAASDLARRAGVTGFDPTQAAALLCEPRWILWQSVDERLANFARCGIERVDEWADQFRLERRISLPRAAALLALPAERWKAPAKQEYYSTLLSYFEKRITTSISRGPLARMTVTKTAPRLDLAEFATARRSARSLLEHLLERSEAAIDLDPALFLGSASVERRLRILVSRVDLLRRETGINGLHLGFPFMLVQPGDPDIKPRIAPVLLWPVRIGTEIGRRGTFSLAFDKERDDVRLNPALQGILGLASMDRWTAARDNILSANLDASAIIDEIAPLAERVRRRELGPLPSPDIKLAAGSAELVSAAVLFHVSFSGQAIVEDIRQLKSIPPSGTALAVALQIADPPADASPLAADHADRHTTAESDPTQDDAVAQARLGRGLVIEGPPGTGKSQTIVNIVTDAVGRKQTVAIVCQKQAALDVVSKRLQREGLGARMVMVKDLVKDRRPIIEAVRNQVEGILDEGSPDIDWPQRRRAVLDRIRRLEHELNSHHEAIYHRDELSGATYRQLIGLLIALEARSECFDVPGLRSLFVDWGAERVASAADVCAGLTRLWLSADYEDSPLAATKAFGWDPAVLQGFATELQAFRGAEEMRPLEAPAIEVDDPQALRHWADSSGVRLCGLSNGDISELAWFVDSFPLDGGGDNPKGRVIDALMVFRSELNALPPLIPDLPLARLLALEDDLALHGLIASAERATRSVSIVGRLSIARLRARHRLRRHLAPIAHDVTDKMMQAFLATGRDETRRRELRARVIAACAALRLGTDDLDTADAATLIRRIDAVRARLLRNAAVADMVASCPIRSAAIAAARQGRSTAFPALLDAINASIAHNQTRQRSLVMLDTLQTWLEPAWIDRCRQSILHNQPTDAWTTGLSRHLASLAAYQQFRARAQELDPDALAVFAALRPTAAQLERLSSDQLHALIHDIIHREACLVYKHRIEQNKPTLLTDPGDLAAQVSRLASAEAELRGLNRTVMTSNIHARNLGTRAEWTAITRLTGARAKRLREFMELGSDIGLMELRPVWLMGPDVASRLLPMRKSLFDQIIYDEASQMPIEVALPTLFRAAGVVVSGDEKQLPPSAFFASRATSDEDDDIEVSADDLDEDEQSTTSDKWNGREVKDCPDLLQLAKSAFPSVALKVHYRSAYRELIAYSNNAFYRGELNVPARHPESEIDRSRPIELIKVGGTYQDRTNRQEAEQVVALLAKRWASDDKPRPTVGVVTFNRDQADLIEELLESRAENDAQFRAAYIRELERREDGEDVGLFVKNVENVQGDERDWIVFSTTFGRNPQRNFRRNFGVLGQEGGERRLNVAITRARQKVIILTSMPISDIAGILADGGLPTRPRDHLQAYLAYAEAISHGKHERGRALLRQVNPSAIATARAERRRLDEFAMTVGSFIRAQGFSPQTLEDDGAFGVDFAIPDPLSGMFGIGIECEAHRHPILTTARAREIWRRKIMEQAFPTIHRVSARAWYETPLLEQQRLREAIVRAISKGEPDERPQSRQNRDA
jgi:primosomal replication protein N''